MVTKDVLIQWLEQSHQQIEQLLDQVDRSLEIYPGWTIRETIAHFNGWDAAVLASVRTHVSDGATKAVLEQGPDIYNAATLSKHENESFDHIYQEWQHTHEQLKIAILDLPLDKMEEAFTFPWGQSGNIKDLVIGLTSEYEVSHMHDIEALLQNDS
jgi:hypothetical protein